MLDQFELALQSGLHGRLSPMVVQQRRTASRSTPPPHKMDRFSLQISFVIADREHQAWVQNLLQQELVCLAFGLSNLADILQSFLSYLM